jgi:hypothetical protein
MKRRRTRRRTRRRNGPNTVLWVGIGLAGAVGLSAGMYAASVAGTSKATLGTPTNPVAAFFLAALVDGGLVAVPAGILGAAIGGPEGAELWLAGGGMLALVGAAAILTGQNAAASASGGASNATTAPTVASGWPQLYGGVNS